MPAIEMKIDAREMQQALRLYAKATRKDEAEIVNRAAKFVMVAKGYGVIRNTKRADLGEIDAAMDQEWHGAKLKYLLAAKKLKSGKSSALVFTKTGKRSKAKKHNRTWEERVGDEAEKIHKKRRSASAFLQSGWKAAAKAGGWQTAGALKKFSGTKLGAGTRAVARGSRPVFADFSNLVGYAGAPGLGSLGVLQNAIRMQARSMVTHAQKTMAKTARKYSGKKR